MKKNISLLMILALLFIVSLVGCQKAEEEKNENSEVTVNNNDSERNEVVDNENIVEEMELSIYGLNGPTSMGMIKLFEENP